MTFVDSAYFVAIAKLRDNFHSRAIAWATSLQPPFVTTEYVLWESINGLSKISDRPRVHALLDMITHLPDWHVVPASGELTTRGIQSHRQYSDKEWSLTDCISFIVMRERGITRALTHDHHFEQAGFEALLQRDPPN